MAFVFISYSNVDYPFVERLIADLQKAGISIFIDRVGLKPGTRDWENALRKAIAMAERVLLIASPDSRQSRFVRDELAIADANGKPVIPVWARGDVWIDCIPMGRGYTQHVNARGDAYAKALQQLVAVLRGEAVELEDTGQIEAVIETYPVDSTKAPRNPYKGLKPFRAQDKDDFFGRSALIVELIDTWRTATSRSRFLAVIGPSGSGKSSVVMAGLLPALQNGALEGSNKWVYLEPMIPGAQPIENLAVALSRALPHKAHPAIQESLNTPTTRGLHMLGQEIVPQPGGRLVLYVDQFEEIFTLTQAENERQQFINLLTTAATEPNGPVMVILSMRADFYDRPMQYGELCALIENHNKLIPPMMLADLYEVVQEPAKLADVRLEFDEGLVTELVFAVRDEPGGLPLLQFTLEQLFQHREDRRLTQAAYKQIGGVRGALRSHAENTYNTLPSDVHRQMARTLFMRLIEPGTTEQDATRRRAHWSELKLPDSGQTRLLRQTAERFVTNRLLVSHEDSIEIAHEALIREWNQLKTWLSAIQKDAHLQKAIRSDAIDWVRRGRKPNDDKFYRGSTLVDALVWMENSTPNDDETQFLIASSQAEELRKKEEMRIARRVQNYQRATFVFLLVLLVAVGAFIYAVAVLNNAHVQRDSAYELGTQTSNDATLYALEQGRVSTLAAGHVVVGIPEVVETPEQFLATETAIVELSQWQVQEQVFEGVHMVLVPSGCFWMGSYIQANEQPEHKICFDKAFWIDRFEVTNEQFEVLGGQAARPPDYPNADYPRTSVNWSEAQAFCQLRGARLPTEAEWEYAARGPLSHVYPWGNNFASDAVVYSGSNRGEPVQVESYENGVSWVGAYHMGGNVWEWVHTIDVPYPYATDDGREEEVPNAIRVMRGGAFNTGAEEVRSANRYRNNESGAFNFLGFRCAKSAE